MTALRFEADPSVGAWIEPRLLPFGDGVGSIVPQGFDAYARVLHPVQADDGPGLVRWADVAAATGRTVHPRAQFCAVAGRAAWEDRDGGWRGDPEEGNLEPRTLTTLLDVLAAHTPGGPDGEVLVGLWEGFGWVQGGGAVSIVTLDEDAGRVLDTTHPPPAFPPEVMDGPRLRLPNREYILLRGPLTAVPTLGHHVTPTWFVSQSPNLLWPVDRSWCVATEIDLDSTLVGGPRALVDAVLAHPDLEAVPVDPHDPVDVRSDEVNA